MYDVTAEGESLLCSKKSFGDTKEKVALVWWICSSACSSAHRIYSFIFTPCIAIIGLIDPQVRSMVDSSYSGSSTFSNQL